MARTISLFIGLAAIWLLLSGYFDKPLILFFGFLSCALTVWIAHRMDVVDEEAVPYHISFSILGYWSWLFKEIAKANIDVTKVVFSDLSRLRPSVFKIKAENMTDLSLVVYANSITLTPGTVTVDLVDDEITIHALTKEAADLEALQAIERQVRKVEG